MTKHLTIRLAWHDNKWDGSICEDPESNIYCSGTHSLLSSRIEREKNIDVEKKNAGKKIDLIEDYQPPCFWSSNSFSNRKCKIKHKHPFVNVKIDEIKEVLFPYSAFSWPFRLSFSHSKKKKQEWGSYPPPELVDRRIEDFFGNLEKGASIVFFYLNYDNPISANEGKYVLLGCSVISSVGKSNYFDDKDGHLERIRNSSRQMKNLGTSNWAIQVSHDFEKWGVLLPYHEYLERAEKYPEEEERLKEMRIIIDEQSIIPNFKYVAAHLDDDQCLYLLYKIKKSLRIIEEHGQFNVSKEQKKIDKLIEMTWNKRGIYPSLGSIIDIMADNPPEDESIGKKILDKIEEKKGYVAENIDFIFDLITGKKKTVPSYLKEFTSEISDIRQNIGNLKNKLEVMEKLTLFNLTRHQLERIVFAKGNPFKKTISLKDIVSNPYLIAENYVPGIVDLDQDEILDGDIDVLKIDIGMMPDKKYLKIRNNDLQNLTQTSPERLRAVIIDYLKSRGNDGDCFGTVDDVCEALINYPIFYKEELNIDKSELTDDEGPYKKHFSDRLTIKENEGKSFFYLNEVYHAEKVIRKTVLDLLNRPDYPTNIDWIGTYVNEEIGKLKEIPRFEEDLFREERTRLLNNVLRKSFFIISGKPGTGKTFVLAKILPELRRRGEQITLLAPTGKATLRLKEQTGFQGAQTIDMYLHKNGYSPFLDDFENIILKTVEKQRIDNLIIDETSMVDLQKLAILFSIISTIEPPRIKRIILVGDEKQLPPIGMGKPFIDIIDFIHSNEKYKDHYIRLKTNCRQKFDPTILELADIFADKNRYYEEIIDRISKGGQISLGLNIEFWKNKDELNKNLDKNIIQSINTELTETNIPIPVDKASGINLLFGLHENGNVKMNSISTVKLDNLQLLTPYRAGYFGSLGINEFMKDNFRNIHHADTYRFASSPFNHADKIIRINNEYIWEEGARRLRLSNGSIGIINNKPNRETRRFYRIYYFMDQPEPITNIDDEENFELAYAITVHKSQGSDFKNIFLVIPQKSTLLSKELMYTALTRSKNRVILFIQLSKDGNPLIAARKRSDVLSRNTSLFKEPEDSKGIYQPDKGIFVKSKIEYIIYTALKSKGIEFQYEKELRFKNKSYPIHPDFSIMSNGQTYFWEHLGELDAKDYYKKWLQRKKDFQDNGFYDNLITTDDLDGVSEEMLNTVIHDIMAGALQISKDERFSKHHYKLGS